VNVLVPVTPWASRILGETIEDYGGGVHIKADGASVKPDHLRGGFQ